MFEFLKKRRRDRIRSQPFPMEWRKTLQRLYPLYNRLLPADCRELEGHIQIFLAEKRFEGCGGQQITDEVRVLIAAQACLLLLHRDTDYYPGLRTVLVYPSTYVAKTHWREEEEMTDRRSRMRLGESWHTGAVVLAWDAALAGASSLTDGQNVVLHEFAHQLDQENGMADGFPPLGGSGFRERYGRYSAWARILGGEFRQLNSALKQNLAMVLNDYGAKNPAEFFAVATECFFEKPRQLQEQHPDLYAKLKEFYRQDPVQYVPVAPLNNEAAT
jgi:Mlc titration factor MtfA (ptsG expression regulator)